MTTKTASQLTKEIIAIKKKYDAEIDSFVNSVEDHEAARNSLSLIENLPAIVNILHISHNIDGAKKLIDMLLEVSDLSKELAQVGGHSAPTETEQ